MAFKKTGKATTIGVIDPKKETKPEEKPEVKADTNNKKKIS